MSVIPPPPFVAAPEQTAPPADAPRFHFTDNRRLAAAGGALGAVVAAAAVTVGWWAMIIYLERLPVVVTVVSGVIIGGVAHGGLVGRHIPLGLLSAVLSFLSLIGIVYLVARSHLVTELGADYRVPLWTGQEVATRLIKAEFKDNLIFYAAIVVSPILAFVAGSDIGPKARKPQGSTFKS